MIDISAFSPSLPKLWHSGADIVHLLSYIQSMISDEDETENSKHIGDFNECLPSSINIQIDISEVKSEQHSDESTLDIKRSCQTLGDFPETKKVRRQLYADKSTNPRNLNLSSHCHLQPTQEYTGENAVTNNNLTLPGPSHSQRSTITCGEIAASENDLTLPGPSDSQRSTVTYREIAAFENDLTIPGPSQSQFSTAAYGEIAASNNDLTLPGPSNSETKVAASKRRLTLSDSAQLHLSNLTSSSRIFTHPTLSQNHCIDKFIGKQAASKEFLTICTPSLSQSTVSPNYESEASNRVLSLPTPIQYQLPTITVGELSTSSKSFVSVVDGIEDIADVDNILGMILLYQHLFDKRTSPWETNDFDNEELHNFTIELEKLDRIYYVYHFDDRVSSREYELLARMNYNGSKVFVHLSAGCDYTGFEFQGTGEIYITRKANFFLKSVVDGSNKPKGIWQALQADGYNVSESTEFDLLPPGLWQSVPTLSFLSHMAVYQHREKLAFYPEVLPPLLRHNLDEFVQVRSTKEHHDS